MRSKASVVPFSIPELVSVVHDYGQKELWEALQQGFFGSVYLPPHPGHLVDFNVAFFWRKGKVLVRERFNLKIDMETSKYFY